MGIVRKHKDEDIEMAGNGNEIGGSTKDGMVHMKTELA